MASVGCQLVPKDVTIVRTLASNRFEVTGCRLIHVRQQVLMAKSFEQISQDESNNVAEHTYKYKQASSYSSSDHPFGVRGACAHSKCVQAV